MADNFCKCKGCKYVDPNERSGYKWYCTWYRSYEDPDIVRECSHFENQNGSGSCFLTSACCQYKGLPDDCKELTTLRRFRDTYLASTAEGKALVDEIMSHPQKREILEDIYSAVKRIMVLIEDGKEELAVTMYREMVYGVQAALCKEA